MFHYLPPLQEKSAFCDLPFTRLIIDAVGDVSTCCHQHKKLGNVFQTDLLTLWKNAEPMRQTTSQGSLHSICTSWNTCPFLTAEKTEKKFWTYPDSRYPTHIKICLPDTHCNIGGESPSEENPACLMCGRNWNKPQQPKRTHEICKMVKPFMPYLKGFSLLGLAEPFWKNAIFDVFDTLEFYKFKQKIKFTTSSNALCLNEKVVKKFFENVDRSEISFSLDAGSNETYQKIRRLKHGYSNAKDRIVQYVSLKNEYHKVKIFNNINMINVHEMEQMVVDAKEMGADSITMVPTTDMRGKTKGIDEICLNKNNVHVFAKYANKAIELSKQLNIPLKYNQPFDIIPPDLVQIL